MNVHKTGSLSEFEGYWREDQTERRFTESLPISIEPVGGRASHVPDGMNDTGRDEQFLSG